MPTRTRRSGNGSAPAAAQSTIAPGTTAASVLTGELRNQIDRIWDAFWSRFKELGIHFWGGFRVHSGFSCGYMES